MAILKTRYHEAYNVTAVANADITGGQLVEIVSGNKHGKVSVQATDGAGYVYGAAETDAKAGELVSVATRGIQWLTAAAAVAANTDVTSADNGRVGTTGVASGSIYGRTLNAATAAGELIPVFVDKR